MLYIENMIYKGLDDEESNFLHLVSKQQAEQKAQKLQEEKEEILLFKISFFYKPIAHALHNCGIVNL